MNSLISVIVPVYNMELFIEDCLESVINQTYKNWEIILVDDGSTDTSGDICDRYAEKYSNIYSFHIENRGQLAASEEGFKYAHGEYIVFLDSDDWIENNMFEELIARMISENVDVVTTGIIRHDITGGIQSIWVDNFEPGKYEKNDEIDYIFNNLILSKNRKIDILGGSLDNKVSKLFKKEFVKDTFLYISKYADRIHVDEDFVFCVLYFLKCKSFFISHDAFYHYRYNSKSKTNSMNNNFLIEKNYTWKLLNNCIIGNKYEESLLEQIKKRIFFTTCNGMSSYMGINAIPRYIFPNYECLKGKRVVVFGAGKVGNDYVRELKKRGIVIVAWIDNNADKEGDSNSVRVETILGYQFDVVLCAVLNKNSYLNMKNQLISLGISEEIIIWKEPRNWLYEMIL